MYKIDKETVFRECKSYCESKFKKDSLEFTDEEEMFYNGYTAGVLSGIRKCGGIINEL